MDSIFQFEFTVPDSVLDRNRHVNNVAYVQWMQDAAVRHAEASGCTKATRAANATWVVRSHQIEYLSPAYAGDIVIAQTWVANIRKVRSLRKYKFIRASDGAVLAQGETVWVFVDAVSGRPRAIPAEVQQAFQVVL